MIILIFIIILYDFFSTSSQSDWQLCYLSDQVINTLDLIADPIHLIDQG